jgi:probable rRNA maturation factor
MPDPALDTAEAEPPASAGIAVANLQAGPVPPPVVVARWVEAALVSEGRSAGGIQVTLLSDDALRRVHAERMGDDTATDVITFPISDPGEAEVSGDVLVSCDTARRVAAETGSAFEAELALYVVHGVLHLCGHDDVERAAAREMARRQLAVVSGLGLEPAVVEVAP